MIATFSPPIPVKIDKTPLDAFFDGGKPGAGEAVALAVSVTEASWFRSSETKFLVATAGKTGWVKIEYCTFPGLVGNLLGSGRHP